MDVITYARWEFNHVNTVLVAAGLPETWPTIGWYITACVIG